MKTMKDYSESDIRKALTDVDGDVGETALQLDVLFGELLIFIQRRRDLLDLVEHLPQAIVEDAESVLSEAVDLDQGWAIHFTLRTVGKNFGWGKFPAKPIRFLPPAPDPGDESNFDPDELKRYHFLENKAAGYADGIRLPDPEWLQRLNDSIDAIRTAFAKNRYNSRRAAAQLGVTHEQLQEYLARNPDLFDAIGDPRDELLCRAMRGLRKAVAAKRAWAVKFVLKTQGRALGYSENPYDEMPRQRPKSEHAPDYSRLTTDETVELDELGYKKRGLPLPLYQQMEKDFREHLAKLEAEKEKRNSA
jgi:hypothetical protein